MQLKGELSKIYILRIFVLEIVVILCILSNLNAEIKKVDFLFCFGFPSLNSMHL